MRFPEDINDVMGQLIDVTFEMSLRMFPSYSQGPQGSHADSDVSNSDHALHVIVHECTCLIGMLGTIYYTSLVFESRNCRQYERINAVADSDH